ncbi:copper transport protein ctr1 [Tulasnella sp. JGI-2019a]|nr:copper transport protein ctr1 [Tulasnella sp. JGI-2019a]
MTQLVPRSFRFSFEHISGFAAARLTAQAAETELKGVHIHQELCAALIKGSKEILDSLAKETIEEEVVVKVAESVEIFLKDLHGTLVAWSLSEKSVCREDSDHELLELQSKFLIIRTEFEIATFALPPQNLATFTTEPDDIREPRKDGNELATNLRSILKPSGRSNNNMPSKVTQFDVEACDDDMGGSSLIWSRSGSLTFSVANTEDTLHEGSSEDESLEEGEPMKDGDWLLTLKTALHNLGQKQIDLKSLVIDESCCLGSGGYGRVLRAMWQETPSSPPKAVVVKRMFPHFEHARHIAIRLVREMTIWSDLNHPNILKMLGFYLSDTLDEALIVCPLQEHGSVQRYLHTCKPPPTVEKRLHLALGVLKGLQFLHARAIPITHGDVKPANVLIGDEDEAVLCDFGLAKVEASSNVFETTGGFKGSFNYCSPELYRGEPRTPSSDIWAWACTAGEIINDIKPYKAVHGRGKLNVMQAMMQAIVHDKQAPLSTKDLNLKIDLALALQPCWSYDPLERPEAPHCLEAFHYTVVRKIALEAMAHVSIDDEVTVTCNTHVSVPVNGTGATNPHNLEEFTTSALSANPFCGFQPTVIFPNLEQLHKQAIATMEKLVEQRWGDPQNNQTRLSWRLAVDACQMLAGWYSRNGKAVKAVPILDMAVTFARQLEKVQEGHSPLLATSLSQLSGCLKDCGEYQRAMDAGQVALQYWRALGAATSIQYHPAFTSVLDTLGHILCHLSRWDEAVKILDEATTYLHRFRAKREVDLAKMFNQLALALMHQDRYRDALRMAKGAVKIMDRCPKADKNSIRSVQVEGFYLSSQCLLKMGEIQLALDNSLEAASIVQELASMEDCLEQYRSNGSTSIKVHQGLAKCKEERGLATSSTLSSECGLGSDASRSRSSHRFPVVDSPISKLSRSSSVASSTPAKPRSRVLIIDSSVSQNSGRRAASFGRETQRPVIEL